MRPGLFVAGTGTDVGKTLVTAGVARLLARRGVAPALMKPVQTGAGRDGSGRLSSPDLAFVREAAALPEPGEAEGSDGAPYLFEPACSPHLAARLAGEEIRPERIVEAARRLRGRHPFLLAEGAGGLLVPLGGGAAVADLPRALSLPVLLVGHGGLGTINHVLLSLEALRSRGVEVLGVVLNETGPVAEEERYLHDDNAAAVEEHGAVAVVARLPWLGSPPDLALLDEALEGSPLAALLDGLLAGGGRGEGGGAEGGPDGAAALRRRSARHVWHPFTEMGSFASADFPVVESARGCTLRDVAGRTFLDGTSSWWCANLGHGHGGIVAAIREQAGRLQHTLLGGASHPKAIELAERLAAVAPGGLGHAMFAADGTLAVEAALKMALQYRHNRGEERRTGFVSLADGYHGDSLAAVGAGYIDAFHRPFLPALRRTLSALSPHCARCPFGLSPPSCGVRCFDSMASLVREHHRDLAAVIVEPLCQAAAGMRIYPAEYLARLRELCDDHGLLLIADEVATGFWRTGAPFATTLAGVRPDLLALGKGLTGGTLPMSATLATDEVFDAFLPQGGRARTFFHGTTFCGNPIAAAAACAALDAYGEEGFGERVGEGARRLAGIVERLSEALGGSPGRALGMIGAVEVREEEGGAERARRVVRRAFEEGLLLRPLGPVVYLWPPLTATAGELDRMGEILVGAARGTARR